MAYQFGRKSGESDMEAAVTQFSSQTQKVNSGGV